MHKISLTALLNIKLAQRNTKTQLISCLPISHQEYVPIHCVFPNYHQKTRIKLSLIAIELATFHITLNNNSQKNNHHT